MAATFPRIDPAAFGKLKSGDESAFERLFRERYAALVAEATPVLDGDGAAAARAVQSVFEQVWKGRDELTTAEAFEASLPAAVHEAAARIKSRHAVVTGFNGHDSKRGPKAAKPAPSVDEAWSRIYGTLHPNAAHAAEAAHEAADRSRHEAAGQLVEMSKPRPKAPMIVGALVIIAVIGAVSWWVNRGRAAAELTTAINAADARAVPTGNAEFGDVALGDSSKVKLGPDSRLRIPRMFGVSIRGLKLEGTANFKVAPGQKLPFVVRAGITTITAAGTEFTVRAYADERDVTVLVRDGSVTATVGDSSRMLAKGAALVVGSDSTMHEPTPAELEQAMSWTDGTVVFNDRPLREMLVLAKRWFALDFFVLDTTLLTRKVSLNAKIESTKDAVASIEASGGLRRIYQGSNMVLIDKAAKAPAPPRRK